MKDKVFIDTNILIYLYSEDEIIKSEKAKTILEENDCVISTQTINEFCNVCIKKLRIENTKIANAIKEILEECELVLVDTNTILQALQLQKKYNYSYFDCLMLSAALNSKCRYIITGDMADKQIVNKALEIKNIF